VHTRFSQRDVRSARAEAQREGRNVRIIVHPECTAEVVRGADSAVSTESMVKLIAQAEPGTRWAIGTEAHLVQRLARQARQRNIDVRMLGRGSPMCGAMLHIAPQDLLWSLDNLSQGRVVNEVIVPRDHRSSALLALERMLRLGA
jgi:quinolinate synthase